MTLDEEDLLNNHNSSPGKTKHFLERSELPHTSTKYQNQYILMTHAHKTSVGIKKRLKLKPVALTEKTESHIQTHGKQKAYMWMVRNSN